MEGLQRSSMSFRRSGSSGLVWEDRFLSGELGQPKKKEEEEQVELKEVRPSQNLGPVVTMERSRSGGTGRAWRTGKVSPAIDPPSPKVSGCGLCGVFGKPKDNRRRQNQRRKR